MKQTQDGKGTGIKREQGREGGREGGKRLSRACEGGERESTKIR